MQLQGRADSGALTGFSLLDWFPPVKQLPGATGGREVPPADLGTTSPSRPCLLKAGAPTQRVPALEPRYPGRMRPPEVRPCGAGWSLAFTSRPCTPWAPPGARQSYRDPEAWVRGGGHPSPAAPELRSPGCDRPPARDQPLPTRAQQRGRVGVNPPSVHSPPGHGDMLELPSAKPGPRTPRAEPEPG